MGWRVLRGFSLYQAEKRAARKKSIFRILYNSFDAVNLNAVAQFGDRVARVQKYVLWSRFFAYIPGQRVHLQSSVGWF